MERLKSKEQRQSSESYSEICEGQTCESNIDFPSETSEMEDIIGIPAKIELPKQGGKQHDRQTWHPEHFYIRYRDHWILYVF